MTGDYGEIDSLKSANFHFSILWVRSPLANKRRNSAGFGEKSGRDSPLSGSLRRISGAGSDLLLVGETGRDLRPGDLDLEGRSAERLGDGGDVPAALRLRVVREAYLDGVVSSFFGNMVTFAFCSKGFSGVAPTTAEKVGFPQVRFSEIIKSMKLLGGEKTVKNAVFSMKR